MREESHGDGKSSVRKDENTFTRFKGPETLSAIMVWGESGQTGKDQGETGPGFLPLGACRASGW